MKDFMEKIKVLNGPSKRKTTPDATLKDPKGCILVVGSTGTGKSSTIAKLTGMHVESGSGHESVTRECAIYTIPGELDFVDTTGWDDLQTQDDVEIFQTLLRVIHRHDLTSVKAVLWTVNPGSIRHDSTLDRQAHLINQFAEHQIWNNVIIICKQSLNPEKDANGALQAARKINPDANTQVTGYRYLNDSTLSSSQHDLFDRSPECRKTLNFLDDDEIRDLIMTKIHNIKSDVQIIFNNFRCLNCNVEGDKRLLPQFCHMEKHFIHAGVIELRHTGGVEKYHPTDRDFSDHPGELRAQTCSSCCWGKPKRKYNCCGGDERSAGCKKVLCCCKAPIHSDGPGCQERFQCCRQGKETSSRGCENFYTCCGKLVNDDGCVPVCKKCGVEWGKPAKECFKRSHSLVEIK